MRAGNDIDEFAAATFAEMHPEAAFLSGPVEDISASALLKAAGLRKGELDCLVGGPPCQAFSIYNHQRGMHDARSGLFQQYLRLVRGLKPRWVVMENVAGITSVGGGEAVSQILKALSDLGYTVDMRVLRAEDYGVPQERRRVSFVGNRVGRPVVWPEPTHGPVGLPYVTVWDAIGDLPKLENGEAPREALPYRAAAFSGFQAKCRGNATVVTHHEAPRLAAINLNRMKHIPEGGSWRDIPFDLLPAGMKLARRCDHTKRYGRLRRDGLSSTILTKCDVHSLERLHPS